MTKENILFESIRVGSMELRNRIVMAPLTRQRATEDGLIKPMTALYYRQRATAGLIISEATNISLEGTGYSCSPGIYTNAQVEAWKVATDAVHAAGGRIFCQLWHVGRHTHSDINGGTGPLAPSAIKEKGYVRTANGRVDTQVPKEMTVDDIMRTIEDYARAAQNAIRAGFDGVEIHAANGYLIDQFLQDGTNQRHDRWGGSIQNRARFGLEVTRAVVNAVGAERTGIRLSPSGTKTDMSDSDSKKHFAYFIEALNDFKLAYLHLLEPWFDVSHLPNYASEVATYFRPFYRGKLIANNGLNKQRAEQLIREGHADLVAFGRAFISNPDLVNRLRNNYPLAEWDTDTFYYGDEKGYTDYPAFDASL